MKSKGLFITGTDTGVGKTYVATALLRRAQHWGMKTAALKPVAAGCEWNGSAWVNEDALALQGAATCQQLYEKINPVALRAAIAPHIAAEQESRELSVNALLSQCQAVLANQEPDLIVVEGAGGWLVPLNAQETMADLVVALQLPVVLVVGMKLGCINHASLTVEAIKSAGLTLLGWVGNCVDNQMDCLSENLSTLKSRIPAPCLGVLPYATELDAQQASSCFDEAVLRNQLKKLGRRYSEVHK